MTTFSSNGVNNANNEAKTSVNGVMGYASSKVAEAVESTQWRKWRHATGHGFSAEDANALDDYLRGRNVDKVGVDNALNGPDRIVNGQPIQVKYHSSAYKSVADAFEPYGGNYKYSGQILEVPSDQYEDAVRYMEERIRDGRVSGVSDPSYARTMVKPGSVTYEQAVKIAKAGNLESLKFDAKNQCVSCACVGGISFSVKFLLDLYHGASIKNALVSAGKSAAGSTVKTMVTGVATQQFLRTAAGRTTMAATETIVKKGLDSAMTTSLGKKVVEKTASAMVKKAVTDAAARNVITRAMSSNVVTATAAGIVTSIPDTYRVLTGKISGTEYGKRMASNAAGVAGGCTGTWAGAAIGSLICPGIGTAIGGFIGGLVGGMGTSTAIDKAIR